MEYSGIYAPISSHSFISLYPSIYDKYRDRAHDVSHQVRAAWVLAVVRILQTRAGGVNLTLAQERDLLGHVSNSLLDREHHVRLAVITALEDLHWKQLVITLEKSNSDPSAESIMKNLADRLKDRHHTVRLRAIIFLADLWRLSADSLDTDAARLLDTLQLIPSRIFETYFINDPETNVMVNQALFENILSAKSPRPDLNSQSIAEDVNARSDNLVILSKSQTDYSLLRIRRILRMFRQLEERGKKAFFGRQKNQMIGAHYLSNYITDCEAFAVSYRIMRE